MTPEEIEALVNGIVQSQELYPAGKGDYEVVERSGPSERGLAFKQGISFGAADEAEAWLRSQFSDKPYDEVVADLRSRLKEYRQAKPGESMGFEIGGAALPSIAAAVLTGGSGAATQYPAITRFAQIVGMGAVEGGGYAFNTGEGGAAERLERVPGGMVSGVLGAGAGWAAGAALGAGFRGLVNTARRKLGDRAADVVEREIRKAAQDGGYVNDQQLIDDIVNGRVLADNKTVASVARAWRAQSAEADGILRKGLSGRPDKLRGEMMDYLQDNMDAPGNARQVFGMSDDAARAAEGAEYNRIFAANPGPVDDATTATLMDAYKRVPAAKKELDKLFRAQTGESPFFRETDQGFEFLRKPTLSEAEVMRRAIGQSATREFASGGGDVGRAYGGVESGVRQNIDDISPDLAAVRSRWSGIEKTREAFQLGQKGLLNADQTAIDFAAAMEQGDAAVKAYRAGIVDSIRRTATTGSRKSIPANIVDENTKLGQVLRTVFPEDDLDELLRRATNATDSQFASNEILGGPQTAITQGRIAEQGISAAETAFDALTGGPREWLRLAGQAVKSTNPQLTPAQAAQAAKLVVETDPHIVARALTDTSKMDELYNAATRAAMQIKNSGQNIGAATGGIFGSFAMPQ